MYSPFWSSLYMRVPLSDQWKHQHKHFSRVACFCSPPSVETGDDLPLRPEPFVHPFKLVAIPDAVRAGPLRFVFSQSHERGHKVNLGTSELYTLNWLNLALGPV